MAGRAPCQTTSIGLAGLESDIARLRLSVSGPAPGFGLPKPVTILVAHLLLNIKKHHKSLKKKIYAKEMLHMVLPIILVVISLPKCHNITP